MRPRLILIAPLVLLISVSALGQQASPDQWEGYADIHVHQMANLGFGGSIIWGDASGPPRDALRPIPANMRRGHDAAEVATHGRLAIFKTLVNAYFGDWFRHGEEGAPSFSSWPSTRLWSHQQAYEEWLFRAYQGGMRLMVMLAENSEDFFGRGENQIPLVGHHVFQKVKQYGRTANDMEALEWQIRAAYQFQDHVDNEYGGKGEGWYRIVRDPDEASEVIKNGKLAVILGTEIQHLFNCDHDRPKCSEEKIVEGLNQLEAMGVNYVFPIHHKLNQFGGPAMFTAVNWGHMEKCAGYKHKCSTDGLTDLGKFLIRELTTRGMLIDTEHLSSLSFNDTMEIVESVRDQQNVGYPVLAGHVVPYELSKRSSLTEREKNKAQLKRILDVGGIIAPLLGTSAKEYIPDNQSHAQVPFIKACATDGGSADQWANAYLFVRDLSGTGLNGRGGRIAMGSDWMGFAGWPGPRNKCDTDPNHAVNYDKIDLPPRLVPDAITHSTKLYEFEWPKGKKWDYNETGVAHAGLMPDFFENVQRLGLSLKDLEPMYRSARGVVELWDRARNIDAPRDRHHLRWAPQSPFDVLNFDTAYRDPSRDVSARIGFPICRTRTGHLLGFEQNGKCIVVEPDSRLIATYPETITAYHNGRCLDVDDASTKAGAKVVQNQCETASAAHLWLVHEAGPGYVQVVNNVTGKCLAMKDDSTLAGSRAVQETCSGTDNQLWKAPRTGNTFSLIGKHSTLCLEVRDQSRKDGAAIQQAACTGASNQLWSIESLRQDDFERLYQADKNQVRWLERPDSNYLIPVLVDDSRPICEADAQNWIGTVSGGLCAGKTYEGAAVTTPHFRQLYQTR